MIDPHRQNANLKADFISIRENQGITMTTKAISHSILAFGLLTLAGAAHAAAPDVSFHPAKGWTVQSAPLSAGTSPLCAIHTEYNNGYGVGFSGAEKNLRALNVDFKQDIFEAGKDYKVSFAVPGNPAESLTGHATNASTLSANVQGSKGLYKVLQGSTAFDLGVEGNEFRFYLNGFSGASGMFEQCMAGAKSKSVSAAPPNASPATINESIALEEQETQKKIPVTEAPVAEAAPIAPPLEAKAAKTAEAELIPAEAQALDRPTGHEPRKRMSEQLAEKIQREPEIAAIESTPQEFKDKIREANNAKASASAPAPIESVETAPLSPMPSQPAIETKPIEMKTAVIAPQPIEAEPVEPPQDIIAPQAKAEKEAIKAAQPAAEPKPAMKIGKLDDGDKIIFNGPRKGAQPITAPEAPAKAKPDVVNKKSPAMVVNRNSQDLGNIDLTRDMNSEPSSGEPAIEGEGAPFTAPLVHIETGNKGAAQKTAKAMDMETGMTPDIAPSSPRKADPEMLKKISELEDRIYDLRRENAVLNTELTGKPGPQAIPGVPVGSLHNDDASIATDNWNLERATMRFTESEREVKRLGAQLAQERAKWAMEKQELEAQLFDPQVTSQQQLARLAELERKLDDAQRTLEDQRVQYEERLRLAEGKKAAP